MTIIEEPYQQRNIIANTYYDNFDYRMNISIKKDRINGRFSNSQDNLNQVIKEMERSIRMKLKKIKSKASNIPL